MIDSDWHQLLRAEAEAEEQSIHTESEKQMDVRAWFRLTFISKLAAWAPKLNWHSSISWRHESKAQTSIHLKRQQQQSIIQTGVHLKGVRIDLEEWVLVMKKKKTEWEMVNNKQSGSIYVLSAHKDHRSPLMENGNIKNSANLNMQIGRSVCSSIHQCILNS